MAEFRGGKLLAQTRLGRIDAATGVPLEGDVIMKTSTGAISLRIPEQSSVRASIRTRTGSVSAPAFMTVTSEGVSRTAVGTNGDGEYTVSLEADTGQVNFTMLPQ